MEHRRFGLFAVWREEPFQQQLSAVLALLVAVHRLWWYAEGQEHVNN